MKKIGLFSEGGAYHSTFMPLVNEFIKQETPISYYTLDKQDKILKINSPYIKTFLLRKGFFGYLKFFLIECDILLSTTPNIGCRGYPLLKPKKVDNLIHIFHSVSDVSIYRKGSLDFYDSVILAGAFQKRSIRELEKQRSLKKKNLYKLGAPYIDSLISRRAGIKDISNKSPEVLVASSWGKKGCLRTYGIGFLEKLSTQFKVTVRPHPYSNKLEKGFIEDCKNKLSASNIEWSESVDPSISLNRADILISDTSAIRFDFKILYNKPVITLEIPAHNMKEYERDFLQHDWIQFSDKLLGPVLNHSNINKLNQTVANLTAQTIAESNEYAETLLYNKGCSAQGIVEFFANSSP